MMPWAAWSCRHRPRLDIGRLARLGCALQHCVRALPPGDLSFAFPIESGLVSVLCGHGQLLMKEICEPVRIRIRGQRRHPRERKPGDFEEKNDWYRSAPLDLSIAKAQCPLACLRG